MSQIEKKIIADRFRAVLSGKTSTDAARETPTLIRENPHPPATQPATHLRREFGQEPTGAPPSGLPDLDVSGWNV